MKATQGMIEHERRRVRRIPVRQKVKIRFGAEDLEGETVDISLSGMLVKAHRTFPPGTSVQLSCIYPRTRGEWVVLFAAAAPMKWESTWTA